MKENLRIRSIPFQGQLDILWSKDEEDGSGCARTAAYLAAEEEEEEKGKTFPSLLSIAITYIYQRLVDIEDSLPTELMKLLRASGCGDKLNRVFFPIEGNALHYALLKYRHDYTQMLFYLGDWAQLRAEIIPGIISRRTEAGFNPRRWLESYTREFNGQKMLSFFDSLDKKFMSMSHLSRMCWTGRLGMVQTLVETDPEILAKSSEGVMNACASGHHAVVDYLLTRKKQMDVDIPGLNRCSQYAANYDHPKVSQVLRNHGMDMIGPRKKGNIDAGLNAVDYHVRNGDEENLRFLVEEENYELEEQAMVTALKHNRKRMIAYLLARTRFVTDLWKSNPAVVEAVRQDDLETLKELLSIIEEKESDDTRNNFIRLAAKTDDEGMNLLHLAAKENRLRVLKFLLSRLEKSSLIDDQDPYHNSQGYVLLRGRDEGRPVWYYVLVGREKVSTFNKQRKTGQIDLNNFGEVIFSGFGAGPDEKIVEKVSELAEQTRANGHRDMTPLHHACINEHEEAVDMLLTHGADPNKQDWDGCTSIHLASCKANLSLVIRLVKAGGVLTTENNNGATAEKLATDIDAKDITNYIRGGGLLAMSEEFLSKHVKDAMYELSSDVMMVERNQGKDLRKHLINVLRTMNNHTNRALFALDSGPVAQAAKDESDVYVLCSGKACEYFQGFVS